MNHTSQHFLTSAGTGLSPAYEMLKEEHEVDVLAAPRGPAAPVRSTVINIRTETSVPDHIVWSLFNTLCMNWFCLGFVAFAYSVKVRMGAGVPDTGGFSARDRKMVGDVIGAQSYASTAKCLNICALLLSLLLTVGAIILLATGALISMEAISRMVNHLDGN